MIHYNPNDILISIHIPKCGGTSLDAILQKWFGLGLHRHYFNTRSGALPEKARLKTWWGSLRKGVCVHGHFNARKAYGVFDYYPQAKQFITVLRDPLEHLISTYYYELKVAKKRKLFRNKKRVSLSDFPDIDTYIRTHDSYLLLGFPWEMNMENYKNIIQKNFISIGVSEDLQGFISDAAQKLGKKNYKIPHLNISQRYQMPNEESIAIFKAKHPLEYAVYAYAKELNDEK